MVGMDNSPSFRQFQFFDYTRYDNLRGFDHGVFIPLKVAFPRADLPIVQVSLMASMDPAEHIRLGQALAPDGVKFEITSSGILVTNSGEPKRSGSSSEAHRASPAERVKEMCWTVVPFGEYNGRTHRG